MRFMVIVKADKDSEAGVMPSKQLLTDMGKFNEELTNAGVMLAGEGLHPSLTHYTSCRLLVVESELAGGSDRLAQACSVRRHRIRDSPGVRSRGLW